MSQSDSDLDFESADEGQNVDIDIENDEDFDFLKNDSKIESPSKTVEKDEQNVTSTTLEKEIKENELTIVSPLPQIPILQDEIEKTNEDKSLEPTEKEEIVLENDKKTSNAIAESNDDLENMLQDMNLKDQNKQIISDISQQEVEPKLCLENIEISSSLKENKVESNNVEKQKEDIHNNNNNNNNTVNINSNPNNKSNSGWNDDAWDDADLDEIDESLQKNQIVVGPTVVAKSISVLDKTSDNNSNNKNIVTEVDQQKTLNIQEEPKDFTSLFDKKFSPKTNENSNNSGGGGWSWSKIGSNFLSTAVNLTSNSISNVLGAPDPLELAAKIKKSESELKVENAIDQSEPNTSKPSNKIDANDWNNDEEWFTMNPLNKLATTGLSVLETVGKKTIEAISEKDPNFKQTREFLKQVPNTINSKPNLSQLLREAQQESEKVNTPTSNSTTFGSNQSKPKQPEKPTFQFYFDEYRGSIHLEALEMLSRQMSVKLEMLKMNPYGDKINSIKSKLETLDQLFDVDNLNSENESDSDDNNDFKLLISSKDKMFDIEHFEYLINEYSKKSSFKIVLDKVITSFRTTSNSIMEKTNLTELYDESIKCFSLITSNLIELYHKSAEASIVDQTINKKSSISMDVVLENAEVLNQITKLSTRCVTILSDDFCKKCKSIENDKSSNQIVTNVYLEASNSCTYICDSYLLFLPIFKSQLMEKI